MNYLTLRVEVGIERYGNVNSDKRGGSVNRVRPGEGELQRVATLVQLQDIPYQVCYVI